MAIDTTITEANAFAAAELIARDPSATHEQLEAASAVLAQSPDWTQRILGRELRAGLYAQSGAELQTHVATAIAQHVAEAPLAIDLPYVEDEPQWMRASIDNRSGGVICLLLVGCVVSLCLAVAVL